jgi:hypothetical protein
MENREWTRQAGSQGNQGQGNQLDKRFSHSLDKHSPDFGFFFKNDGQGIFANMRESDGLQCINKRPFGLQSVSVTQFRGDYFARNGMEEGTRRNLCPQIADEHR